MTWGWLKPLFEALIEFFERQANKPRPILEDVNTPISIRQRWSAYIVDKLRNKGSGN